jgi:hypothetical protein
MKKYRETGKLTLESEHKKEDSGDV